MYTHAADAMDAMDTAKANVTVTTDVDAEVTTKKDAAEAMRVAADAINR